MDFKQFRSKVVDVPVEWDGETFTVGYCPREILDEDLKFLGGDAESDGDETRDARIMVPQLVRLVRRWDLTWDGEPWPATADSFAMIEPPMRLAILRAVMGHYFARPNQTTSSQRSSEGAASGPIGRTSASEPSSGALVPFPGTTPASPSPAPAPSGATG